MYAGCLATEGKLMRSEVNREDQEEPMAVAEGRCYEQTKGKEK
jgi:hypothetical protein